MSSSSKTIISTEQKFIIIGGGPSGLYTAIKLVNKGINPSQITICDPRIGSYTRPGHLAKHAFEIASKGIGVDFGIAFKRGESTEYAHIKDIERALYEQLKKYDVNIVAERFDKLTKVDNRVEISFEREKSIHLTDNDFLFDCSGANRVVLKSVNAVCSNPPFMLENITSDTYKHHFLAYVKVSTDEMARLTKSYKYIEGMGIRWIDDFKEKILALRELGWKENDVPRCYWVPFGKDKFCFYIHAPEALAQENYDKWFKAVLGMYDDNVKYEHLKKSRRYDKKPRFVHFKTSANSLVTPCFSHAGLPQVIALGDAMIDPDYYLAHGISNSFILIDELVDKNFFIKEKKIGFNERGFISSFTTITASHKEDIQREGKVAKFKRDYFFKVAGEIAPEVIYKQPSNDI